MAPSPWLWRRHPRLALLGAIQLSLNQAFAADCGAWLTLILGGAVIACITASLLLILTLTDRARR